MNRLYEKAAKKITEFFINKSVIKDTDREIYQYGYELILSQSVYIIIMIAISVIFHALVESLLFFIGFYIYRKIAGGYHANTYLKCHILFAMNQLLFLLVLYTYPASYRYVFIVAICIIALIITFFVAPIDHPNKPFDNKEFKKYKMLSRLFCIALIPLVVIVICLDKNNVFCFCFSFGILSANVSLLYAYIERRLRNEKV